MLLKARCPLAFLSFETWGGERDLLMICGDIGFHPHSLPLRHTLRMRPGAYTDRNELIGRIDWVLALPHCGFQPPEALHASGSTASALTHEPG